MHTSKKALLNSEQRENLAKTCPGWVLLNHKDAIQKTFIFSNFQQAFDCMTKIAEVAEKINHHPEWFNVWNRLEITLSTHDSGGLTQNDLDLAEAIEVIYTNLKVN